MPLASFLPSVYLRLYTKLALRAEEELKLREEEEKHAAEEAARKKKEDELAALRAEREKERQEALEKTRLQQQREEEAEERRRLRRLEQEKEKEQQAEKKTFGSVRGPPVIRTANGQEPTWRRSASGAGTTRPTGDSPRAESPAPIATSTSTGPPKYRPGALGGWRERDAAKQAAGGSSPRAASPALPPAKAKEEPKNDDDGFQPVSKPGVWKPRRAQQATGGR